MKNFFTLLILAFFSFSISAQVKTGTLKGKIIDTTLKQNFRNATISVLKTADSSIETYGLTKGDGSFQIDNIPFGEHLMVISFIGFKPIEKKFSVTSSKPEYNTGILYPSRSAGVLNEIVIKAAPVSVNGDTTEFNASQYKTIPNATTEDLLKKLPGVEVDKDGVVKAQGETVTRVLVDGKKFFGNDPKLATKNIPAEIIDKIQVIDALSDQSAFSGFDDGDRIKTINIITKKDRRKGWFGKVSFGAGDQGRYSASLSANRFNGNQQISFIGQSNNINNQNFSIQDFLGSMSNNIGGGGGRGGGGGIRGGGGGGGGYNAQSGNRNIITSVLPSNTSGLTKTTAAGLNYNDVWGKKNQVNASYFYNDINSTNNTDRYRETFVANDSSLFNNNQVVSNNNNKNHRFNFELDHMFDSSNSLMIRPEFSYQQTDNTSETNSYTSKGKLAGLSQLYSLVTSQNEGYNFSNSILFRHKFKKRGRTFSINFNQSMNTNDRNGTNLSYNDLFSRGIDTVNQVSKTNRDGKSYGANLSYTEPIGKKSQLEVTYNYNHNKNNSDQQTFKMDKVTSKYDITVPNLTNFFENSNISNRVGLNYRTQVNSLLSYALGMAVQHADLVSNNITKSKYLSQSFYNFFPNVLIQYRKLHSANLRFSYRGNTQQPSITQLQDVIDNSNVLNIKSGNPSLKQEFSNNFQLTYNTFNVSTFKNFSVNLNASFVSNKIENATTINTGRDTMSVEGYKLSPGAQFSKPQNVNGAFSVGSYLNYGFPVKATKINLSLTGRFNFARDVNIVNNVRTLTDNYTIGGTERLTMNLKERFDLNFFSTSTYNIVRYSTTTNQNGDYFTQRFSAEPTYSSKSGWILSTDFDYLINTGQSTGYNVTVPLWNAAIAKLFMKDKQAEIRFSVFDMLNQNKSITRDVEQTYVEDVRSQVLQRYFMLTLTYNLRKFKGQQPGQRGNFDRRMRNPDGNPNGNFNGGQFRNRN